MDPAAVEPHPLRLGRLRVRVSFPSRTPNLRSPSQLPSRARELSLKKGIVAVLELGAPVTEAAGVSKEHLFGLLVTIQHVLPPGDRHIDHALGLLHEHEVSR